MPLLRLFLVTLSMVLLLVCPAAAAAQAAPSLLAVEPHSPWTLRELQLLHLELVSYDPDTGVTYVIAGPQQIDQLSARGYRFSTVEPDVDAGGRRLAQKADLGAYTTHAELVTELERLASTYPEHCMLSVIGLTVEGRPIHALKISDEPQIEDAAEPDILIVGNHHARELMSVEVPLHLARYLLEQATRDRLVGELLAGREIWIVPMLNPDGHVHQEVVQGRPGWRKNRRLNEDLTVGVDLNRNYSYQWGLDDVGSTSEPFSETYRGPSAFSEPETAALRSLVQSHEFVLAISYHSFGELLLYPWGWTDRLLTPDHSVFEALADSMVRDNHYRAGNPYSGAIYLTNGEFDDFMYGQVDAQKAQQTFSFTVELNSQAQGGFWPDESYIQPTCDKLLSLNLYAIRVANQDLQVILPPPPAIVTLVQSEQEPWRLDLSWSAAAQPTSPVDHYEVFEIDPVGAAASSSKKTVQLQQNDRSLLAEGLRLPERGQLALRLSADLEPLWDYAYVEARAGGSPTWTPLAGTRTTSTNPTGYNTGNGLTGPLQDAVVTFDASAFQGQAMDIAIRLAAHPDSPRDVFVSARLDLPRTFEETRRVLADNVQETHYTVIAERVGIFAYGVTTVAGNGQRTDSDVTFVNIPAVTEVAIRDIALQQSAQMVTLQWQVTSPTKALFEAWTRDLQEGDMPGSLHQEWQTGLYRSVASKQVMAPGRQALTWRTGGARQAVVLMGSDADGRRFWGPWVTTTNYRTALHAAVPNPFNPQTRLRFELARAGSVQLDLYGADGRHVRRLLDEMRSAGSHDVVWDGRDDQGQNVASGVYLARFLSAGVSQRQRLVLLR